jgi:hypothetical protein
MHLKTALVEGQAIIEWLGLILRKRQVGQVPYQAI